jgi:hypothetical protein
MLQREESTLMESISWFMSMRLQIIKITYTVQAVQLALAKLDAL